jgi:hypothetical protein
MSEPVIETRELTRRFDRILALDGLDLNVESGNIIPMLALSDRADLRRLSLYAVEAHASPAHKVLLNQLLLDPDSEVSLAAEAVQMKLNDLANVPVDTLRAKWRITNE